MFRRYLGPILMVAAGLALAILIYATGPRPERQARAPAVPVVRTMEAAAGPVRMIVGAHGTVLPKTESNLVAEVSGRVVRVSSALVSGGFFAEGELLVEIERVDYEAVLEQSRARLASARSELAIAEREYRRQRELSETQSVSESRLDESLNRLEAARASARAATARLARAERDLERTRLTAPYDGRVRSERVDTGQFVTRGEALAKLYSTDLAEVRLPIADQDLAWLPVSLARGGTSQPDTVEALLRGEFAGQWHEWPAKVLRTEGELDPVTRVVNLIAQVENPYEAEGDTPPLTVGLFVEAEIYGNEVEGVQVLPRSALQAGNRVYVIGPENRLSFRNVEVLRITGETVYVQGDIRPGESICVSALDNALEGQTVLPSATGPP